MPLRRTKRSDGRHRPRWKDGSHANVENTDAEHSRCDGLAFEPNTLSEPLERVRSLLGLNYELKVSTRDRPARTGADARIEGSGAKGEVRLALRPYGRAFKLRSGSKSEYGSYVKTPWGALRRATGWGISAREKETKKTVRAALFLVCA